MKPLQPTEISYIIAAKVLGLAPLTAAGETLPQPEVVEPAPVVEEAPVVKKKRRSKKSTSK